MHETEPYRGELKAHCYRMLGSAFDAEDAVQETLLRAWRSADRFEKRTSLRNWLYRIATNVCLTTLARRPEERQLAPLTSEVTWLEPYPDDPEAHYERREATQLAFVAAIQYLPPRQRAALLLHDVLRWSAAETAEALGMSVPSANSALQRARETLEKHRGGASFSRARSIDDATQRALVERYVRTWERLDVNGFVALLKEDALFSMPPRSEHYRGREAIRSFLPSAFERTGYDAFKLVPIRANGQFAFGLYGRDSEEREPRWEAHAIVVLALDEGLIAAVTLFLDTKLFELFDLPPNL